MTATATLYYDIVPSSLGDLLLTFDSDRLVGLEFDARPARDSVRDATVLREPVRQLRAYLAGDLDHFELDCDQPGTLFQRRVWTELMAIPYGETISYAELARRIGQPHAARAVGGANGRNRIAIVVPCHRVIAADGTLGGYGGELWRKELLLNLERR